MPPENQTVLVVLCTASGRIARYPQQTGFPERGLWVHNNRTAKVPSVRPAGRQAGLAGQFVPTHIATSPVRWAGGPAGWSAGYDSHHTFSLTGSTADGSAGYYLTLSVLI